MGPDVEDHEPPLESGQPRVARLHWPLFDLVVRTPLLELRHPDDEMCARLADVASPEMFPGGENQFRLDWVSEPPTERRRRTMQWYWRARATISPESWLLTLAVVVGGQVAGVQDLHAERFAALRSVTTGSWLSRNFQGRGLGTEMRLAVLHLAFVGLGAHEAHSSAFETNLASIAVSRRLGYDDNGEDMDMRGEVPGRSLKFRMTRHSFESRQRHDIEIEHLDACLPLLGL